MRNNKHYLAISEFYGTQCAKRSHVPLIAHIDEGLRILDAIGGSARAKEAFCIHPMLQADEALRGSLDHHSVFNKWALNPSTVLLAMEYRHVANAYLSHHFQSVDDHIDLSVSNEVNDMLIADKVQNRKDFEIYHLDTHKNSAILAQYFRNWLKHLGVSETQYRELVQQLDVINR